MHLDLIIMTCYCLWKEIFFFYFRSKFKLSQKHLSKKIDTQKKRKALSMLRQNKAPDFE